MDGAATDSRFAPARVDVERRADGTIVLRAPVPPGACAPHVGTWLERWAERTPDGPFLAERQGAGWHALTYAAALREVRAIGAALLDRGLSPERPVLVLAENGIDHALLALGAQLAGVPYAPVSPAYSLLSADHAKLKRIVALLDPGLVYLDDAASHGRALPVFGAAEIVASRNCTPDATPFGALRGRAALPAIAPDAIAKFLFTSGSTGEPKAVVTTQRMLCANQSMLARLWPFLEREPPVLLDWLPWSHTFGGSHNFNLVLANGGTLHIDDGRPVPGRQARTLENLRLVAPTLYFSVPRGYAALVDALEADAALARRFFSRLRVAFYAGAALPPALWERLARLAAGQGSDVALASAWGATETAPMATAVHGRGGRAGAIGLPVAGSEIKLVPDGAKLELRVRGPHVTPGYWKRPDLTRAAFDDEGFYRTGDAARFADPADPARGLEFDGRIAEDFKLASGTWVHVGALRLTALAALAPLAQDVVVAGHDREAVALLVFPDLAACRALAGDAPDPLAHPRVRAQIAAALRAIEGGSSMRPARALLLAEPPALDRGEITDKGYVNQRAVLAARAEAVARLYADPPPPEVVCA